MGRRYAVLVGVDQYPEGIPSLSCAKRDVHAIAEHLQNVLDYNAADVFVLTEDDKCSGPYYSSKANVLRTLAQVGRETNSSHTLLFHFSGHGIEHDGTIYLLPANVEIEPVERLRETAISVDDLRACFKDMALGSIAFIMDCCRNDPNPSANSAEKKTRQVTAMTREFKRDIVAALGKSTSKETSTPGDYRFGVMFACRENETALEWSHKGHGFFTYYFLECLRVLGQTEEVIDTKTAASYIMKRVNAKVGEIYPGYSQRPWDLGEAAELGSCRGDTSVWSGLDGGAHPTEAILSEDSIDAEFSDTSQMDDADTDGVLEYVVSAERKTYDVQLIPAVQEELLSLSLLREIRVQGNESNRCFLLFKQGEPVFLLPKVGRGNAPDQRILLVDPGRQIGIVCVDKQRGYLLATGVNGVPVEEITFSSSCQQLDADFIFYETDVSHSYRGTAFAQELLDKCSSMEAETNGCLHSETAQKIIENFELFRDTDEERILSKIVNLRYDQNSVWIQEEQDSDGGKPRKIACFKFNSIDQGVTFDENDFLCVKKTDIRRPASHYNRRKGFIIGTFARIDRQQATLTVQLFDSIDLNLLRDNNMLSSHEGGSLKVLERQKTALKELRRGKAVNDKLAEFLLDASKVEVPDGARVEQTKSNLKPYSFDYDQYQKEAIEKALAAPQIALIQGPPGTGKTTVICEIIRQTLHTTPETKVLLCSQSNMAVDNVLEKIVEDPNIRAIRVGSADRITGIGKDYVPGKAVRSWLELLQAETSERMETLRQLNSQISLLQTMHSRAQGFMDAHRQRHQIQTELREKKDAIQEKQIQRDQIQPNVEKLESALAFYGNFLADEEVFGHDLHALIQSLNQQEWHAIADCPECDSLRKQTIPLQSTAEELDKVRPEIESLQADLEKIDQAKEVSSQVLSIGNLNQIGKILDQPGHAHLGQSEYLPSAGQIGGKYLQEARSQVACLQKRLPIPIFSGILRWWRTRRLVKFAAQIELIRRHVVNLHGEKESAYAKQHGPFVKDVRALISEFQTLCEDLGQKTIESGKTVREAIGKLRSESEILQAHIVKVRNESDVNRTEFARVLQDLQGLTDYMQENFGNLSKVFNALSSELGQGAFVEALGQWYELGTHLTGSVSDDTVVEHLQTHLEEWPDKLGSLLSKLDILASTTSGPAETWQHTLTDILTDQVIPPDISTQYLDDVNVLAGTCIGLAPDTTFQTTEFDLVVIDEAGRATPLELLVPMLRGRRFVLVGDHKQLPPQIDDNSLVDFTARLAKKNDRLGSRTCPYFKRSFFDEFFKGMPEACRTSLQFQYRMHPSIRKLVAGLFYQDINLREQDSEALTRRRSHEVIDPLFLSRAKLWLDTSRRSLYARRQEGGFSLKNEGEAEAVRNVLFTLQKALCLSKREGPKEVGVITFYNAQKWVIRRKIDVKLKEFFDIEVDSIDAFQGREKDVIILSTVASNQHGNVSEFVASPHRLNVALSRARQLLIVIGDKITLSRGEGYGKELFERMIELFDQEHGVEPYVL